MPATVKTPLGAATLNRKWFLDVNSGTHEAPVWVGVFGITDLKAGKDPTLQDDSDFDSAGWKSSTVSALGWNLEVKLERKVKALVATAYDAGQELLRAASDGTGTSNNVEIRWYEMTSGGPKVEAYQGYASVSWVPDCGAMDALDTVSVTLNGVGARTAITHPDGASSVPSISSATPLTGAAAGGNHVTIYGVGFTGVVAVSGVKIAGTNSTAWTILNDNTIVATVPAHAVGSGPIVVTNATGPSTTGPTYTYS